MAFLLHLRAYNSKAIHSLGESAKGHLGVKGKQTKLTTAPLALPYDSAF
ncbi:MAG: hypothetical protein AAFZ92_06840 [Pseudomonadota bacterium]